MKFKTSLKGRLDAEISNFHRQQDDAEEEPEITIINGVARRNPLPKSISIKAPWKVRQEKDDKPTKNP